MRHGLKLMNPVFTMVCVLNLCGVRHAYMPIEVHVLDEPQYIAWLSKAEQEYAQFEVENENTQLVKLTN